MSWMELLAYSSGFSAVALAGAATYPLLAKRVEQSLHQRVQEASVELEDMFITMSRKRLWLLHLVAPIALAGLAWVFMRKPPVSLAAAVVGLVLPRFVVRHLRQARAEKFHSQLVDSLLLLSNCLRAGLSMLQGFSVLAEEMPAPISEEFGLVLKEVRMGVSLDEALQHLQRRMPSDELNLFITTVVVARETGGDVTIVFSRLVETLRERKKIHERVKTLTFMARLQGVVMAILPVVFVFVVFSINKMHVQFFLHHPFGRMLLGIIILLELTATILFIRFSRSPV